MINSTSGDTRILGTLRAEAGKGAVVHVEDLYDTDIDDLWSAVTEPERLAHWVAKVTGDTKVGGEFTISFTSGWDGPGKVEVCDAPHRLLVAMNAGEPDATVIEALLSSEGDRTRLVIEERYLPVDAVAGHGAGWQAHIEDLATYLAGREPGPWRDRWQELTPTYLEIAKALQ